MSEYKLKQGKAGESIINAYQKVEDGFTNAFLKKDETDQFVYMLKTGKVGDAMVSAYKKVEDCVVGGYKKVENAFIDTFLEKVDTEKETADAERKNHADKKDE